MSISLIQGGILTPLVRNKEEMLSLIKAYRLIPFFSCPIPDYSIEEHTPPEFWFTENNLGPWDWKIDCVQSGDIAYGKFLCGGKAAFATADVYTEIINWRRSLPKYQPTPEQQKVLDYTQEHGSVTASEVRKLMGMNKGAADSLLCKIQMQTRILTGDITRVYRGADLQYNGWQRSSFCTPEALFEDMDFPFPGFTPRTVKSSLSPEESLVYLKETIRNICGDVPDKLIMKVLG